MAEVAAHHHHPSPTRDTPSPRPHPHLHPLPQSQPQLQSQLQPQQQSVPHGKKRPGDNSLESEQRLSKRFDLLNLDKNGTRLYIPVPGSSDIAVGGAVNPLLQQHQTPTATTTTPIPLPTSTRPLRKRASLRKPHKRTPPPQQQHQPAANDEEFMQIDPTPHKIYIHDLSAELSSSSASENEDDEYDGESPPIFLSDIERHLSKIPRHVLLAGSQDAAANGSGNRAPEARPDNQMVLYNVPSSLSVPQERDSVRKAIVEARARVRERQACGLVEPERVLLGSNGGGGGGGGDVGMGMGMGTTATGAGVAGGFGDIPLRPEMADPDVDVDAMDID